MPELSAPSAARCAAWLARERTARASSRSPMMRDFPVFMPVLCGLEGLTIALRFRSTSLQRSPVTSLRRAPVWIIRKAAASCAGNCSKPGSSEFDLVDGLRSGAPHLSATREVLSYCYCANFRRRRMRAAMRRLIRLERRCGAGVKPAWAASGGSKLRYCGFCRLNAL